MGLICFAKKFKKKLTCFEKEYKTNLFDQNNIYVLFSGTGINGNGPFRHLNDLFLILFLLIKKNIPSSQIYLTIDINILASLDSTTGNRSFPFLDNGSLSYRQIFETYIDSNNIIPVEDFEKKFHRDRAKDLVFIASGHGAINGLSIDGTDGKVSKFLSSDYFEKIANEKNRTILIMSQCQAAAFHHLDTRKNLCVMGASDYQSSVSLKLAAMTPEQSIIDHFAFEEGLAINPFIFSLFAAILMKDTLIINEKHHLINLFKYVTASTLTYLSKSGKRQVRINREKLLDIEDEYLEFLFEERILIQQPFLLNKILAARIYI